jgi:hypothetical protein
MLKQVQQILLVLGNSSGVSLGSDSSSYGTNQALNDSSQTATYVGWGWKANGSGSSNTDGDITSTVSASTTSGFSIVSYTGTGSNATVGHGLGVAPQMIIVKNRDGGTDNWGVYHKELGANNWLKLNTTDATATDTVIWNNTAPTSSVFSVGTSVGTNESGENFIAYCFAEKKGFSKFGSYTGNGSTNGTFVYTGFKPAFVIYKKSSASATDWIMVDNKRNTFNVLNKELYSNESASEGTVDLLDFTSNGFKCRRTHTSQNESGQTYIYMAFAENPFVTSTSIPCTAR